MTHPFVYRTIPASHIDAGEVVEIDERIAPLIDALWLAGFETCLSCQGGMAAQRGSSSSDAAEAKRFVRIATTGTEAWEVPRCSTLACAVRRRSQGARRDGGAAVDHDRVPTRADPTGHPWLFSILSRAATVRSLASWCPRSRTR